MDNSCLICGEAHRIGGEESRVGFIHVSCQEELTILRTELEDWQQRCQGLAAHAVMDEQDLEAMTTQRDAAWKEIALTLLPRLEAAERLLSGDEVFFERISGNLLHPSTIIEGALERVWKIKRFLTPTNPADDPLVCLACMGGLEGPHTCPPPPSPEEITWTPGCKEVINKGYRNPRNIYCNGVLLCAQEIAGWEMILVSREDLELLICRDEDELFVAARNRIKRRLGGK